MEMPERLVRGYATVTWRPEDIQTLIPSMSDDEASEWLANNSHHIANRMVEDGWEAITHLLEYDGYEIHVHG